MRRRRKKERREREEKSSYRPHGPPSSRPSSSWRLQTEPPAAAALQRSPSQSPLCLPLKREQDSSGIGHAGRDLSQPGQEKRIYTWDNAEQGPGWRHSSGKPRPVLARLQLQEGFPEEMLMKITRLAEGRRIPECTMEAGKETNMKPACAQLSPVTILGTATTTCPSSQNHPVVTHPS